MKTQWMIRRVANRRLDASQIDDTGAANTNESHSLASEEGEKGRDHGLKTGGT